MFQIHTTNNKCMDVVRGTAQDMLSLLHTENVPEPNRDRHAKTLDEYGEIKRPTMCFGGLTATDQARGIFAETGWPDGEERARAEMPGLGVADLAPEASAPKRRRAFADEGDTLRVEMALSGNWGVAYETRRKRQTRIPVTVSIGCAFGANANVGHRDMFWNGLQMAAICDLLESAGWRVELRALKANDIGRHVHCQDWTVKQADQPLRLDTTLALFGHAGVYRCFGWLANSASAFKTPANFGTVLKDGDMTRAFRTLQDSGVIAPLSLILPPAFSREAVVRNLRHALESVRNMTTGAAA